MICTSFAKTGWRALTIDQFALIINAGSNPAAIEMLRIKLAQESEKTVSLAVLLKGTVGVRSAEGG